MPGGGVALVRAGKSLEPGLKATRRPYADIRRAIEELMRHIATNAGAEGPIVVAKVRAEAGRRLQRRDRSLRDL